MTLVDVGAIEEFPEGKARVIVVNDREIGVVRWHGHWFALRNICPHLGAPVCEGALWPKLSQPSVTGADLNVDADRPVLVCPWHKWEFEVHSGASVTGKERLKAYSIEIENGRVLLNLDRKRPRRVANADAGRDG